MAEALEVIFKPPNTPRRPKHSSRNTMPFLPLNSFPTNTIARSVGLFISAPLLVRYSYLLIANDFIDKSIMVKKEKQAKKGRTNQNIGELASFVFSVLAGADEVIPHLLLTEGA